MHIRQASINILNCFFFLHILTEGAVSHLHINHLILILNKELTTVLTLINRYIRHDILEVAFRVVRVEMRVILNVYFFEPHIAQHVLVHFDRAVISTRLLVQ